MQLLLAYHDIAQLEHLFGARDVARTVLSNAKMRLLLPGLGDLETLRQLER
ncbi:type IV secretory pathway TraG/TraD family ATPase VirD4 [Nocardioides soli]|uniref:Type IV secretory pathway TraG/TraD family ATPase VirD4 n=1 Tax=Nocardioides soli TaxID=1036020 RepID=A0A7W4Z307_9ACTN|nr:type IV secretory pathway TraG/TraD family ATPase VirD4 [Nocardioides soli]